MPTLAQAAVRVVQAEVFIQTISNLLADATTSPAPIPLHIVSLARTLVVGAFSPLGTIVGFPTSTVLFDVDTRVDFAVDLTSVLGDDVVVSSTWSSTEPGLTLDPNAHAPANTPSVWVSGIPAARVGRVVQLTCRVTTAAGLVDDHSFGLYVTQTRTSQSTTTTAVGAPHQRTTPTKEYSMRALTHVPSPTQRALALAALPVLLAGLIRAGLTGPADALPRPFPTAVTAGPPAGTVLTSGPGEVCGDVDGRIVDADLELDCDSTVTNSRIPGRVVSNGHQLTGRFLDIGPDACPTKPTSDFQLIRGEVTLRDSHIHNSPGQDPVALLGHTIIRDSLIDRTCYYPGDHLDGAQLYDPGAATTAVLRHNWIDVQPVNSGDQGNSAVFLADRPGRGTTILIQGNFLAGGGYTLAAYDAFAGSGVVYDVRNNVFAAGTANYAPCSTNSAPYDGTSGLRFRNNRDEAEAPISCR